MRHQRSHERSRYWRRRLVAVSLIVVAVHRSAHAFFDLELSGDMRQTTVVKDKSGKVTESSESIPDHSAHKAKVDDCSPSLSSSDQEPAPKSTFGASPSNVSVTPETDILGGRLSGGYTRTFFGTTFATDFSSESLGGTVWRKPLSIRGRGGEVSWSFGDSDRLLLSLRLGFFGERYVTQHQETSQGVVQEQVSTSGFQLDAGLHRPVLSWLYGEAALGLFGYNVTSSIVSNTPEFVYHGLDGSQIIAALGLGGGLQTPGQFPVKAFAGMRFWLPVRPLGTNNWGIAQFVAGLAWEY